MFASKLKSAVVVFLVLGVAGSGMGLIAHRGKAGQPPPEGEPLPPAKGKPSPKRPERQQKQETPIPAAKEAEVKLKLAKTPAQRTALLKATVAAAEKAYRGELDELRQTRRFGNVLTTSFEPEKIHLWSVRWLEAQRKLSPKHEDHVAALEAHLKRMIELRKVVKQLTKDLMPRFTEDEAEWYQMEAELWLSDAKAAK